MPSFFRVGFDPLLGCRSVLLSLAGQRLAIGAVWEAMPGGVMHKRKSPSSLSELAIPLMRISPLHSVRKTHYGHPSLKAVVRTNLPRTTRSMATEVTVAGCYEADGSAYARFMGLAAGHG